MATAGPWDTDPFLETATARIVHAVQAANRMCAIEASAALPPCEFNGRVNQQAAVIKGATVSGVRCSDAITLAQGVQLRQSACCAVQTLAQVVRNVVRSLRREEEVPRKVFGVTLGHTTETRVIDQDMEESLVATIGSLCADTSGSLQTATVRNILVQGGARVTCETLDAAVNRSLSTASCLVGKVADTQASVLSSLEGTDAATGGWASRDAALSERAHQLVGTLCLVALVAMAGIMLGWVVATRRDAAAIRSGPVAIRRRAAAGDYSGPPPLPAVRGGRRGQGAWQKGT